MSPSTIVMRSTTFMLGDKPRCAADALYASAKSPVPNRCVVMTGLACPVGDEYDGAHACVRDTVRRSRRDVVNAARAHRLDPCFAQPVHEHQNPLARDHDLQFGPVLRCMEVAASHEILVPDAAGR